MTISELYAAVGLGGVGLTAALAVQLCVDRYIAWVYWLAVVMVSVFGTMAADVLHLGLGVLYAISTAGFTIVLAAVFIVWHATRRPCRSTASTPRAASCSSGPRS